MSNIVIPGFWFATGKKVSVYLAGLDCGDYTVGSDGSISVPYGSDPDGLLTVAYLQAVSAAGPYPFMTVLNVGGGPVSVPLIAGFTYLSEGQVLPPDAQAEAQTPQGPALAKVRRVHQYGVRLFQTIAGQTGLSFGASFSNMRPANVTTLNGVPLNSATLTSGTWWDTLDDDYSYDGSAVCWQITRPVPCTVLSIIGFTETSER